jgi:carbonic anhydrase
VKHVIVCGHYGCNLVRASSNAGLGDPWRRHTDPIPKKIRVHNMLTP